MRRIMICTPHFPLNIVSSIVTGDETWVHGYDPETK
jgi:hypothetical protein